MKRQWTPLFNKWYAFELLPQHLEAEALQTYSQWVAAHKDALQLVEEYWSMRVEMMTAIKETAVSFVPAASSVLKEEGDSSSGVTRP